MIALLVLLIRDKLIFFQFLYCHFLHSYEEGSPLTVGVLFNYDEIKTNNTVPPLIAYSALLR